MDTLTGIFLQILNMSITASYVMFFVMLLRLLLRKMPKIISSTLWLVVFIRLICPFSFSSAFSLLNGLNQLNIPLGQSGPAFVPDVISTIKPVLNGSTQTTLAVPENVSAVADTISIYSWITLLAAALWIMGLLLMIGYSIVSYLKLKNKLADAILLHDQVYETDAIASPFVFGFIKPRIILPVGMTTDDIALVLLHEQTHLRRRDYLIKPAAFLILAVHRFNPLIWLAYFLMSRDLEMSCDEAVVKRFSQSAQSDYGRALLRLSLHRRIFGGNPLAFGENGTKARVKNILNYQKPAFWLAAAAVIVALAIGVNLLTNPQDARQPYVPVAVETLPQGITVQAESAGYPADTQEIKLIVRNQSKETIQYGSRYAIEQYDEKQGIWRQAPFVENAAFDGLLHQLKEQDTDNFFIDLSMLRDKPGVGQYRVWLLDDRITCEFALTNEPSLSTALLPEDITIISWANGQVLQSQVITETRQKQIVMDAVQAYSLQSTRYPALSLDQMGDYISIHLKNLDSYSEDFYVFNLDGQNCLQYGLEGQYSAIDDTIYATLIGTVMDYEGLIGSDGLPLSLTMTIQSGDNMALAMARQMTIQDKQTGKTESLTPITPQSVAGTLQYLLIDFSAEQDTPFTPYVNGQKVYGMYVLYDNEMKEVPFFMPSGLAPQTYIFHDAKPGQYIVGLTTSFETEDSSVTCQYFFGVTLPEPTPNL